MSTELNKAIAHAVNYHSLDAKLSMPDWKIADLIEGEVQKWLDSKTDIQIIDAMTDEERSKIGHKTITPTVAQGAETVKKWQWSDAEIRGAFREALAYHGIKHEFREAAISRACETLSTIEPTVEAPAHPPAPGGFVLVPVDAALAMLVAGAHALQPLDMGERRFATFSPFEAAKVAWAAMIANRPSSTGGSGD